MTAAIPSLPNPTPLSTRDLRSFTACAEKKVLFMARRLLLDRPRPSHRARRALHGGRGPVLPAAHRLAPGPPRGEPVPLPELVRRQPRRHPRPGPAEAAPALRLLRGPPRGRVRRDLPPRRPRHLRPGHALGGPRPAHRLHAPADPHRPQGPHRPGVPDRLLRHRRDGGAHPGGGPEPRPPGWRAFRSW